MKELHTNKQLRNFSVKSTDGKTRLSAKDIREMSYNDYLKLRKAIGNRNKVHGNNPAIAKKTKKIIRKVSIARKVGRLQGAKSHPDFKKHDSVILDSFYPKRKENGVWKPLEKRKKPVAEIDLDVFSLIDRPEETFEKFELIAEAECQAQALRLNFNDSMCFDMSAYLLLGLMQKDLPNKQLQGGKITEEVSQVLNAVGLSDYMNIVSNDHPLSEQIEIPGVITRGCLDDVMPFHLASGGGLEAKKLAQSEQRDEKVANNFVDTLKNDWIAKHNPKQKISEDAYKKIKDILGELFDNALRHGKPDTETGEWHTVGVLQKRKNKLGQDISVCNLAIINIGMTVSETLDLAPADILSEIQRYVDKHKGSHPEDTLKTVCAMQDKISRIDPKKEKNAALNGMGLMNSVLNVMNPLFGCSVAEYQPRFTLLSGKSWLSVSAAPLTHNEVGTRTLAFNENNDISEPPDNTCVQTLKHKFPGTIISLRFVIGGI